MKKILLEKRRKNRLKIVLGFICFLIVLAFGIFFLKKIDAFFDENTLQFQSPVILRVQKPIWTEKRQEKIEYIIKYAEGLPKPETPFEEYIFDKWGPVDGKIAIAIARAESGMREEAINVNHNGSLDIGIFQINSVHWKKEGCSPKELFDAYKNVDCAYKIWQASGWSAWTVAKNGSFLRFLK
ncbi:MAG: transglycosylase SLT domain-containing protein [candidate division WOR-3 bacterium]